LYLGRTTAAASSEEKDRSEPPLLSHKSLAELMLGVAKSNRHRSGEQ
jgi:hypothetical protein